MHSTVWISRAENGSSEPWAERVHRLLTAMGVERLFRSGDLVGVKIHVGERDKRTFNGPEIGARVVSLINSLGGKPFFTDTCVLYRSPRADAVEHTRLAEKHGYSLTASGAPFISADGLTGGFEEEITIPVRGGVSLRVAGMARRVSAMIVIGHPTGHLGTGYGGIIKTLGMGLASRKGKLAMHSVSKPFIRTEKCIGCGTCLSWCPVDAISIIDGTAKIDKKVCIGCGECVAACRYDAVGFDWKASSESLQKGIAEHALAVMYGRTQRFLHLSVALNVTKDCDCLPDPGPPLFPDIGILGSWDPVAVDQATLDQIEHLTRQPLSAWSYPNIDPTIQLRHAETIGLGSRSYKLTEVD